MGRLALRWRTAGAEANWNAIPAVKMETQDGYLQGKRAPQDLGDRPGRPSRQRFVNPNEVILKSRL